MNFIFRAIRFLFWVLVLSWAATLLRRVIVRMLRGAGGTGSATGVADPAASDVNNVRRLVRDPVCGLHVAEYRAIPLREGSELLHFCSTSCRDQYLSSAKKLAAHG